MRNQSEQGMFKSLTAVCCLLIATQLLPGCSTLTRITSPPDTASTQNKHITEASQDLRQLAEIDSLIKLNNKWLAAQFRRSIEDQAKSVDHLDLHRLNFRFSKQFIHLEAIASISDEFDNIISTSLSGVVKLEFSAEYLRWIPRFEHIQISSRDFTFETTDYAEGTPELESRFLQDLNANIGGALINNGANTIAYDVVPLGEIRVGAELPGLSTSQARHSQTLRGVFMVAGSAVLIESASTTVALDLTFIPDLTECPADVTISRAEFARNIESREPVGVAIDRAPAGDVRYFFSEISDAREPLTIIHYWYANGLPLAVEELPVEPSRRWRTWSANGSAHSDGDHLKVLVVEKSSGCILLSRSIRTREVERVDPGVDQAHTGLLFSDYRDEFSSHIAGFPIGDKKPAIALFETRRVFLRDVLQASVKNLNIDAHFDQTAFSEQSYTSRLQPFNTQEIVCEQRDCPPAPICKINISHCKRNRDTRECMSCLFRNPLNNRCISEAIDPLCEAARKDQNDRYEAVRNECIARAAKTKEECDQLNAQALRSCQIESGFADSACEAIKASLDDVARGVPLAYAKTSAQASGPLRVNFSSFRIEGDLERLKLDMALISGLELAGDLNFNPADVIRPLGLCITDWSAPFRSRFTTTHAVKNLLSSFEETHDTLTAPWSGFGLTMEANPSPLEKRFVGDPQLLATCKIGLTVQQVEEAMTGDGAGFYRGRIEIEVQPLPTTIHLAPASLNVNGGMYSAAANLSASHIRYDIRESQKESPQQRP